MHRRQYGRRAQAFTQRTVPKILIQRINYLMKKYETIPLLQFSTIYHMTYNITLDATNLGFDDGLLGLFSQLPAILELRQSEIGIICCIPGSGRSRETSEKSASSGSSAASDGSVCNSMSRGNRLNKTSKPPRNEDAVVDVRTVMFRRRSRGVFSAEHKMLWFSDFKQLLKFDQKIVISQSPFEWAHMKNPIEFKKEVDKVHLVLSKYPEGVLISELNNIIRIRKVLFDCPSINFIVAQFPEMFYVSEKVSANTVGSCQEALVFDGITRTCESLSGADLNLTNPERRNMVYMSIMSGIYQKTLVLIKQAGSEGLKVSVWRQSLKSNFKSSTKKEYEKILLSQDPLTPLLCLSFFKLLTIKSHQNSKNDLRLHYPPQFVNFSSFINQLVSDIKADRCASSS